MERTNGIPVGMFWGELIRLYVLFRFEFEIFLSFTLYKNCCLPIVFNTKAGSSDLHSPVHSSVVTVQMVPRDMV